MATNSTFSVIGPDVVIRGNLEATADLHVDGAVYGDIACASLVSGEGSTIEGEIMADSARLSGRLSGTIRARALVVLKSARIEGDVHYETLTIEQGAIVNGRLAPHGAQILTQKIEDAEFTDAGDDGRPANEVPLPLAS